MPYFDINPTSGEMSGEVRINPTSSNYNNYDRNTNVTVGSGGVAKFFAICQYGLPYLVYEGLEGEADPSNTTFPTSGGTMLYMLYSHYPWYFQSKPWWLTITDELGNTINEGSVQPAMSGDCHCQFIRFTAMANTGATRDSGNFRLLHRLRGSEAAEVVYIQFDQEAATSTPSITTPSDTNVPCTGGTVYVDILVPQGTPWHFANINSNYGLRFYDSAGTEFNYWQDVHSGTGVTERYSIVWPSYSGNEPRTCKPVLSMRVGAGAAYYDISPSFTFTQNPCASLTVTPNPIEFPPERQIIIYSAYTVDTTSNGSASASTGSPYKPQANFYASLSGQYYAAGYNGSWSNSANTRITGTWTFTNADSTVTVPVIKGAYPSLNGYSNYSTEGTKMVIGLGPLDIPFYSDYAHNEIVVYITGNENNAGFSLTTTNGQVSDYYRYNGYLAKKVTTDSSGNGVVTIEFANTQAENELAITMFYQPNTERTLSQSVHFRIEKVASTTERFYIDDMNNGLMKTPNGDGRGTSAYIPASAAAMTVIIDTNYNWFINRINYTGSAEWYSGVTNSGYIYGPTMDESLLPFTSANAAAPGHYWITFFQSGITQQTQFRLMIYKGAQTGWEVQSIISYEPVASTSGQGLSITPLVVVFPSNQTISANHTVYSNKPWQVYRTGSVPMTPSPTSGTSGTTTVNFTYQRDTTNGESGQALTHDDGKAILFIPMAKS